MQCGCLSRNSLWVLSHVNYQFNCSSPPSFSSQKYIPQQVQFFRCIPEDTAHCKNSISDDPSNWNVGVHLLMTLVWLVSKPTIFVLFLGNVDGSIKQTSTDTGMGSGCVAQPNSTNSARTSLQRQIKTIHDSAKQWW